MKQSRRRFLASSGLSAAGALCPESLFALAEARNPDRPKYSLTLEPCKLEIAPGIVISTTAYNGQVPGPLLRLRQGVPVAIDVTNRTGLPDLTHWHGLTTDSFNDGAMEEGSPMIAPGATLRYRLNPNPHGTRWYHTHAGAYDDLSRGTYSGQFGFLLVERAHEPSPWDAEINLVLHHWEPHLEPMVSMLREKSSNQPLTTGSDVGYRYATMNGHMLGAGEPIRVKPGQRVLMRLLNASATENVVLALPGHQFRIIAMDGNPVPNPRSVEILSLAVAERVDAIVEMNSPGVWVLGSVRDAERQSGLGVVIEYAGASGAPRWTTPAASSTWDYSQFANRSSAPAPDETVTLTFRDSGPLHGSKFDTWTINNQSWPNIEPIMVRSGLRYRLVLRNGSGDQHPIHLHRHSFEVTKIGDTSLSGLTKDVVNVMPLETVEVDFVADNPGNTLIHCHQQLHMDYGFMQLIEYKSLS